MGRREGFINNIQSSSVTHKPFTNFPNMRDEVLRGFFFCPGNVPINHFVSKLGKYSVGSFSTVWETVEHFVLSVQIPLNRRDGKEEHIKWKNLL